MLSVEAGAEKPAIAAESMTVREPWSRERSLRVSRGALDGWTIVRQRRKWSEFPSRIPFMLPVLVPGH